MGIISSIEEILIAFTLLALLMYRFTARKLNTPEAKHDFTLRYLLWPAVALVVLDIGETLTYNGTRLFTENVPHYNFGTALDAALPIIPFFIVFYLLAYAVLVFAPFYLAWVGDRELVKRYILALSILFAISSVIYLVAPNDVPHAWSPDVYAQHTGIFDRLLEFMYNSDAASNGLPSLHNAHIWLPFFLIIFTDRSGRKAAHALPVAVLGVLISLATLFCKEHYIVDVVFSISLVAGIAWLSTQVLWRHEATGPELPADTREREPTPRQTR
ncbi:MAG: phosphatase PAP2 family protein [Propionibacteriaceae bacterium]|nr:phosphatase PAP2 family protein [Propionibacteriaceae bacterium]